MTRAIFAKIQPENIALIRHISLRGSLLDLTPSSLQEIEEKVAARTDVCKSSWLFSGRREQRKKIAYANGHVYEVEAKHILTAAWEGKSSFIAKRFPALQTLQLKTVRTPRDGGATTYVLGPTGGFMMVGRDRNMVTISNMTISQKGSWKKVFYLAIPQAGAMVTPQMFDLVMNGWDYFKDAINPQAVFAFERTVQQVSQTGGAVMRRQQMPISRKVTGNDLEQMGWVSTRPEQRWHHAEHYVFRRSPS